MEEASILKLIMEKGPREGETLEFRSGTIVRIGRVVRGNTMAIKDKGISSKHISIQFDSESRNWLLYDLDSSNGTILNAINLTPNLPYQLNDGDCVKIGEFTSIIVKLEIEAGRMGFRSRHGRGKAAEASSNKVETSESSELGLVVDGNLGNNAVAVAVAGKRNLRPRSRKVVVDRAEERQVSSRRMRSSKKGEVSADNNLNPPLPQVPEAVNVSESDSMEPEDLVQVEEKKIRGAPRARRRPKRVLDEPSGNVESNDVEENLEQGGDHKLVSNSVIDLTLPNMSPEDNIVEEQEVGEVLDVTQGGSKGLGQDNLVNANVNEDTYLEKMTLGEWFDYLEVHLAKEIYDATEKLISNMKQQDQKFQEFRSRHNSAKDKGKLPMN